jgi:class 3 adenylate cyclase
VVKQIGDEFMVRFNGAGDAVGFGVDLESATAQEPHFPAVRVGAHTGDVLYRDGDYVGANVNLAARVTAEARGHQFVVTAAVHDAAGATPGAELVSLGARTLKGIADPVELFEVRSTGARKHRPVDPVCLMQIDPASCAIRLDWRGTELYFCSDDCLRRFVDAQGTTEVPSETLPT